MAPPAYKRVQRPGRGRACCVIAVLALALASPGVSHAKPFGHECRIEVPEAWIEGASQISRAGGALMVARISHNALQDSIDFYTQHGARRLSGTARHDVLMVWDHPADAPEGRAYVRTIDGHPSCTVVVEFANPADDALAKTVAASLRCQAAPADRAGVEP